MGKVQRDGKDKLMAYIRDKSDFYTAPASTKFHLSCEGGLLQHSLNVYDCLIAKKESPVWKDIMATVPEESIIIMSLLHDLCKTNFYIGTTKNQKTYEPRGNIQKPCVLPVKPSACSLHYYHPPRKRKAERFVPSTCSGTVLSSPSLICIRMYSLSAGVPWGISSRSI